MHEKDQRARVLPVSTYSLFLIMLMTQIVKGTAFCLFLSETGCTQQQCRMCSQQGQLHAH